MSIDFNELFRKYFTHDVRYLPMSGRFADLWYHGITHQLVSPSEFNRIPVGSRPAIAVTYTTHTLYTCETGHPELWIVPITDFKFNEISAYTMELMGIVENLDIQDYFKLLQLINADGEQTGLHSIGLNTAMMSIETMTEVDYSELGLRRWLKTHNDEVDPKYAVEMLKMLTLLYQREKRVGAQCT